MERHSLRACVFVLLCAMFFCINSSAEELRFKEGEEISYSVKLGFVKVGSAKGTFLGKVEFKGNSAYLFNFHTKTLNFVDLDEIYSDLNFEPIEVKRTIRMYGKDFSILEEYNRDLSQMKQVKTYKNGKTETQTYKQNSPLQNVILLFYGLRNKDLKLGDEFSITLYNGQHKVKVVRKDKIKIGSRIHTAFMLESGSKDIRFWIGEENHLPLKMQSPMMLTSLTLTMTDVKTPAP